jgi:tRNA(Met) C34 N-acetyltransferase TmcA
VVAKGEEPVPTKKPIVLNEGQSSALTQIHDWLESDELYFALRGYAGTGKSTLMKEVSKANYNLHFSAPTNQATKILSDFIGVTCKTTYSLLGLRMVAEEDTKVLSMGTPPELGYEPILVIDEAGMLQKKLVNILMKMGYRCLFVGDPAQLNPIGEVRSKAWRIAGDNKALLTKVNIVVKTVVDAGANTELYSWVKNL